MITKAAKRIILLFVCPFLLNKLTPKSFPKNDFKQNIVAGNSDHHPGWIGLMRGRDRGVCRSPRLYLPPRRKTEGAAGAVSCRRGRDFGGNVSFRCRVGWKAPAYEPFGADAAVELKSAFSATKGATNGGRPSCRMGKQ